MSNGINYSSGKLTITVDGNQILTASADGVNVSGNLLLNGQVITGSSGTTNNFVLSPNGLYDRNVSLMLNFSGTNNSTNIIDSSYFYNTITVNGNAKISTAQSKYGGSSGYFDGTGDYLTIPQNAIFNFGTGDFTIESWIKMDSLPIGSGYPDGYWIVGGGPANSSPGFDFYIGTTNLIVSIANYSSLNINVAHGMSPNIWYHVAIARSGNTLYAFKDGALLATGDVTGVTADPLATGIAVAAAEPVGATGGNFKGYIDDLRITKGVGRYTSNFTPPTQELDAFSPLQSNYTGSLNVTGNLNVSGNITVNGQNITSSGGGNTYNTTLTLAPTAVYNPNVALLLDFSGSDNSTYFVDKSFNALSITPQGNAKISVTESKFGGSSGYFDGSGDYLKVVPNNRLDFGTGDFTLETWIYPADLTYRFICGATANAGSYLMLAINPTAGDQIWMGRSGLDWPLQFSGHTLTASVWSHLAISRQGDQNRLFINGTQIGGAITDTTSWSVDPNGFWIGAQGGGNAYSGYLDDFRITKGVALYTGSFTAPTQELTGGLTYVQSEYSGTFNLTGNLNVSGAINTIGTNTWAKPQVAAITNLTSTSNSTAVNLGLSNNYKILMTENTQLANPTNVVEGQSGIITIVQPEGTYYTMSYGTFWKFASGSDKTLTAKSGAIDVLAYYVATSSYSITNLIKDFV